MVDITPIPGPLGLPFLGNALSFLGEETPILGFERLADIYGPIYQVVFKGTRTIVVSSAAILEELVDEKRFQKLPPLAFSNDSKARGLFAAATDDPDWGQAHRILIPEMGPLSTDKMFDDMKDIANQLVLKWARKGPEDRILLTDDFTRLTLDTIALCTMKYRFNSFYSSEMHPYVDAMMNVLQESGSRSTRPAFISALHFSENAKFQESEEILKKTAQQIIDNRRANPVDEKDLLNAMIYGKDPKTGLAMRDELIAAQMTTFLIAGHETTSGLLSFTFMYLLKNSSTYLKAQKEVDDAVGKGPINLEDLKKLKYLTACLREALRLSPTATALSKKINPESHQPFTFLNKTYKVESADRIFVLLGKSQRDPAVYGEDAAEFKPERMLDEDFNTLPDGAWKPFGNGVRACIGRPFAWQEALLVAAITLQHFDLRLDDPSYELRIKQTLTIKPKDLYVRTTLRDGIDATSLDHQLHGTTPNTKEKVLPQSSVPPAKGKHAPMTVLYGSNTGTCLALAQRLSSDALARGFDAEVLDMDSAVENLPRNQPVVIITPSYEGQPPDNAERFMTWLGQRKKEDLVGVKFAVFGCGHKDWARTFHLIPKLADELMAGSGGQRIVPMGLSDLTEGNVFGDFEDWEEEVLWPKLTLDETDISQLSVPVSAIAAEISTNARASTLRHDLVVGTVNETRILTAEGESVKQHMEIQLPSDSNYECGDYLAILPLNSEKNVKRTMTRFGLPWDAIITIKGNGSGPSAIPNNTPLSIYDVLKSYVELSQPATKGSLKICAQFAESVDEKLDLEKIALNTDLFKDEIINKRVSVIDILYNHPSISLPFQTFLFLLPPLRVRQYSISSSPLQKPDTCTITYGSIHQPAFGDSSQIFDGVTSTYLSSLVKGDRVQCSLRTTSKNTFRIPADGENTPLLMFAAGTGVAPFRGFLQQRSVQMTANPERKLANAVLFLGCRSQTKDRLYAEEMDQWVKDGVVDIHYTFSKEPEKSEGCKYVNERMKQDASLLRQLWKDGARVYVCGSRLFDKAIGEAAKWILMEERLAVGEANKDTAAVEKCVDEWFANVASQRIATDVFD
ncbi:Bifunctional cytochrome P450/NADPH--P450 reductase [Lachnellula cervina]|uniref:Bifunctional cytochrome P450/NADPH--P450 reductase n=1 Tax=Lachnellula cervina TaxID=1316786 RepID=A0A7D8YQZ0_9HELO|nr:Bifunctional cytochrome P450/NADPH--P450 reductase [Lachnellula cervina]